MEKPPPPLGEVPEAIVTTRERRGIPLIWVVPLVALLIGLALVWRSYMDRGPKITIHFENAEGVEAGKTHIKYRDVVIGVVESVHFSRDYSEVVVRAQMDKGVEGLLRENTRFWVVRARLGLTRASGLYTLVSGVYIGIDPGREGRYVEEFQGLKEPPNVLTDDKGTLFHLRAATLGSLSIDSPVYYRQVEVGRVTGYHLQQEENYVRVDIYVNSPHDRLVRSNSRFWNASGISVDLSGEGVRLNMESLTALVSGGVEFDTPEELGVPAEPAPAGTSFQLYPSRADAEKHSLNLTLSYVLYFNENVRGLTKGAPVEFRGIRVGTVKDIALERDPQTDEIRIPVLIAMEPERIPLSRDSARQLQDTREMRKLMERLVARGLRARLQTGNLLTGQLIVDFEFVEEAKPETVDYSGRYPRLPTAPNKLSNLLTSLSAILSKLEKMPLDEIGLRLLASAEGLDRLVNDPKLQALPQQLASSMDNANALLSGLNHRSGPLLEGLDRAVNSAEGTLDAIRTTISTRGALGGELVRALQEFSAAARAVKSLSEYMERHPEALLQGKRR
jgi:paraquat-inducible protein B